LAQKPPTPEPRPPQGARAPQPPETVGAEDRLRIGDFQFEDERGDVRYSLITAAGTDIVLTFHVEGFERREAEPRDGVPQHHVQLHYEAELRDPEGVLVAPGESGEVDTMLGPRDNEWRPRIRWSAALPRYAPSGEYTIALRVKDILSGDEVTASVPVRVRGEALQPTSALGIQQLEYANSPNGPWFPRRVFALGRPIHARYKVAGFQVSPENEVWVEQDWTVIDAEGNVIVHQPNAVVDQEKNFYPTRFLQSTFELQLENPKPGPHTFRIVVRDRIGGQTVSTDSEFTVRP